LKNFLRKHPFFDSLFALRGNTRACVYTEPLWSVPMNLYAPYISVYMAALLLTDKQIGMAASVTMLFKAVSALFSGAVTDKLGRKLTTLIFDVCGWSIPCLIWAFSQNVWWFMAAAAFNGLMQVTDNSWNCLLVEDAEKSEIVKIYSFVHMTGQLAVVFAPLAGILIDTLDVIPTLRILYFFSFLSMTAKFIILYFWSEETRTGLVRKQETASLSIFKIMSGYGQIFRKIFASREMVLALVISAVFGITTMISVNFFGLYTTGNLLIPQQYLAYFPILRAIVIAVFLFVIQPKLNRFGFRVPMLIGVLLYAASHVVLMLAPPENVAMPLLYIFFEACAYSFILPRRDSLMVLLIDPAERARIISIMTVITLSVSIPFGYLAGWLSDIDRRLPFGLDLVIFAAAFVVIAASRKALTKQLTIDS